MKLGLLPDLLAGYSRCLLFSGDGSGFNKAIFRASAFSIHSALSMAKNIANPTPNTQVKYHIQNSFQISV